MTRTSTSTPAVLYICATRSGQPLSLAEQRAVEEGHSFAEKHGLYITAQISDPYGEPNPCRRSGWLRVREMAERGEVGVVLTRWPSAVSCLSELRYPELDYLGRHGTQLFFTWAPLSAMAAGGGAR
ncbi:hypothetical protein [Streptomyces sp. NPDC093707]|uniref:hypothetical protein n=1 Tax=Streptomyces sp. NPDC093707 TaxID=3154984 RepID=UPI00344DA425